MDYQYKNGAVIRISDNATIPVDVLNSDYIQFLADKKAGAVVAPADVPNPNIAINAAIAAIEQATMVPRIVREEMLIAMQDKATAMAAMMGETRTATDILAASIAYRKVKAVDDQIKSLRSQLT